LSRFQTYPEEDGEKIGRGSSERFYILRGVQTFSCFEGSQAVPLVLLAKLLLTEGKALKVGFLMMAAKNLSKGFTAND
jgi:hypothetical protein